MNKITNFKPIIMAMALFRNVTRYRAYRDESGYHDISIFVDSRKWVKVSNEQILKWAEARKCMKAENRILKFILVV